MKSTHLISRWFALPALAWICCLAICLKAAEKNASYRAALESITSADLTGYVNVLADAKMEGREAGTRGGRAAGEYLIEQFAKFNLRPAGEATPSSSLSRRITVIFWE